MSFRKGGGQVTGQPFEDRVRSVAALADPVRRALYGYVVSQPEPVSREQAASGLGIARHAAKFHLDKLEEDGLLAAEFRRPPGRRGPGAGRPAKHYRRADRDIEVSLPERHYDLAGELLARAIVTTESTEVPVGEALRAAATAEGRELGARTRAGLPARAGTKRLLEAVAAALTERGYAPQVEGSSLTLANCPFHVLARNHTELVCGMNLDLLDGLLDGLGPSKLRAHLRPSPGRCCVRITAS
jgi:predicted ArsR family transcriptional regulator